MKEQIFNDDIDENKLNKSYGKKIFNSLFPFDNNEKKFIYDDNIDLSKVQEHVEYITQTLDKINRTFISGFDFTKIPIKYITIKILIYFLSVLIFLVYIYVTFFISIICLFNPMIIIIILLFGNSKIISFICKINFKFYEVITSKKIKIILEEENEENLKKKPYIIWKYGRDGSWIEIIITNEESII